VLLVIQVQEVRVVAHLVIPAQLTLAAVVAVLDILAQMARRAVLGS
jgi:hypothetical protein